MRRFFLLTAIAAGVSAPSTAVDWKTLRPDMEISAPRIAWADIDGDGDAELVVGGRTGSFPPWHRDHSARLVVLQEASAAPFAASVFGAVRDVAGADLDGDGKQELVVAGGGQLEVMAVRDGSLVPVPQTGLPAFPGASTWGIHRVDCMDVDGDGGVEIAWTETGRELSGEGGVSTLLRVASVSEDGSWQLHSETPLRAHVGDLCFADLDGDGRGELVVETGVEEVGGRLDVFSVSGRGFELSFSRPADPEARRLLSLTAVRAGARDMLIAATVDGAVSAFVQQGQELQGVHWRFRLERGARITGVAGAGPGREGLGTLELLIGCSEPGRGNGALVSVSGLHR